MTLKPMEIAGELPDHEGRMVPCVTLEEAEGYANERVRQFYTYLQEHAESICVQLENDAYLVQHPNAKPLRFGYEPGPDDE